MRTFFPVFAYALLLSTGYADLSVQPIVVQATSGILMELLVDPTEWDFEELSDEIEKHLGKDGVSLYELPELIVSLGATEKYESIEVLEYQNPEDQDQILREEVGDVFEVTLTSVSQTEVSFSIRFRRSILDQWLDIEGGVFPVVSKRETTTKLTIPVGQKFVVIRMSLSQAKSGDGSATKIAEIVALRIKKVE